MKLFISWSGELSQRVALHLREWLPVVLPFIDAWVSSEDIPKGTRWGAELANQLEGTDSGIVCLVPGNLGEAWLNFEAGALSKTVSAGRIHPFLFGLDPGDLVGPLGQFQATRFSKDDVRRLVKALNSEASAVALRTDRLDVNFDICWPDLERRLTSLSNEVSEASLASGRKERTPDLSESARDLLLEATRDPNGVIMRVSTMGGAHVETNQRDFVESGNARSEARWRGAVDELRTLLLVEDRTGKGEVFFVTDAGYRTAERLRPE